ncbi:uncharacterized protein YodC (DUF2158 family) [Bradyrhizobium japonicum]
MRLRPGNLVTHKSGGPIMMIERVWPEHLWLSNRSNYPCDCIWVEDRVQKAATFPVLDLQAVHADGSPRSYDTEIHD